MEVEFGLAPPKDTRILPPYGLRSRIFWSAVSSSGSVELQYVPSYSKGSPAQIFSMTSRASRVIARFSPRDFRPCSWASTGFTPVASPRM
jgi:hypothetical protein